MTDFSMFYYPYSSISRTDVEILKMATIFFDKIYMLDPLKATNLDINEYSRNINSPLVNDVEFLKEKRIIETISPSTVFEDNDLRDLLTTQIKSDIQDKEFKKLCNEIFSKQYWNLSIEKIPPELRNDPKFIPVNEAMRDVMRTGYTERYYEYSDINTYSEFINERIELRNRNFDIVTGEAIMINHAIISGMLFENATPTTNDILHETIFKYKIEKILKSNDFNELIDVDYQKLKTLELAKNLLVDIDLSFIPTNLSIMDLWEYRTENKSDLESLRKELGMLSRTITSVPYDDDFNGKIYSDIVPNKIYPILKDCEKNSKDYFEKKKILKLKNVGVGLGAGIQAFSLTFNIFPFVTIPLFLLSTYLVNKSPKIDPKTNNGLHFLFGLKNLQSKKKQPKV